LFGLIRDVEAAKPRAIVLLMLLATGRGFEGAASLRSTSPAFSANVFLLKAGSGTAEVSDLLLPLLLCVTVLQPETLCLVAVGCASALREFILDSCSSPSGRPCDEASLGT
jgi:hypothetical protein